jgi:hypothetical protein
VHWHLEHPPTANDDDFDADERALQAAVTA